ncbi:MAG: ATP-grasp domain-containing protein, partial [Acidimicrobiales bacterium]
MHRLLLLLPSATYRAEDFLTAARELGVEVVVATDRPQATAAIGGRPVLVVDLDEPRQVAAAAVDLARRLPLDAVVAVDDQGVRAAAAAAAALGLPH